MARDNGRSLAVKLAVAALIPLTASAVAHAAGRAQQVDPSTSAPAATAPAADVARSAPPIVVLAVQGTVHHRPSPESKWVPAKAGDVLTAGTEISTLTKSIIQIQIGAGQIFTIDRLSRVKIAEALNISGTEKSTLELPYGRVKFDVTSTQFSNDVKLVAPDATLAVRGTEGGLDVTPGQPTNAFGGEFNTGRFDVEFDNGITGVVTGNEQTDQNNPNPAKNENLGLTLDIGDQKSRDQGEQNFVQNFSFNAPALLNTPTPPDEQLREQIAETERLFGSTFFSLDLLGSVLTERDLFGNAITRRKYDSPFSGPIKGMTIVQQGSQRILYAIENTFNSSGQSVPVLRMVDISDPNSKWSDVASYQPGPTTAFGETEYFFDALSSFAGRLFVLQGSVNTSTTPGHIFELPTGGFVAGGSPTPQTRMVLGMNTLGGMAAGGNGTLYVPGTVPTWELQYDGGTTFGESSGQPTLVQTGTSPILLQVDPRNNFIENAWTASNGLTPQSGTQGNGAFSFSDLQQVTSMSFAGGTLVIRGVTGANEPVTIQYNPAASNTASDPRVVRVNEGGNFAFNDWQQGSIGAGNVPSARELLPPTGAISTALDPTFAAMGYSTQARLSGAVEMLLRQQVLAVASDPARCLESGALQNLGSILPGYDFQQAGMGQAAQQFYTALQQQNPSHPCLPIVVILNNGCPNCPK
ncbi:MAG: FecR domain-containing protein [Phycisphaerales bacterium]|jgi:hypothetical protein|nr:FecR domain-containing protein [Phycisphaeraceae bacterium]